MFSFSFLWFLVNAHIYWRRCSVYSIPSLSASFLSSVSLGLFKDESSFPTNKRGGISKDFCKLRAGQKMQALKGCPQEQERGKAQIKVKGQSLCIHHFPAFQFFPPHTLSPLPTLSSEEVTVQGVKIAKKMTTFKSSSPLAPSVHMHFHHCCYQPTFQCSAFWGPTDIQD